MSTPAIIAIVVVVVLALIVLNRKKDKKPPASAPDTSAPWFGPIIPGYGNYSKGMPYGPTPQGAGWTFTLGPGQEVDAVIRRFSLKGKTQVKLRVRVEGDTIRGSSDGWPARMAFMFQRKGDNWSATGAYNFYRWYARKRIPMTPGEHEVTIPLVRGEFGHVTSKGAESYTDAQKEAFFQAALNDTDNIACGFGSDSASHGIVSATPARITLLALEIS